MFGESWENLAAFRLQNIAWLSPNRSTPRILERCMILPPTVLTVALPTLLAFNGLLGRTHFAADEARLLDLDGRVVNPFNCDAKLVAFIFVRTDCPISNSYAPEIQRLHERFAKDGVAFWLVYPSEDELPAAIRRHLSEFSFPCGALRDPRHVFAQRSKVQVTPEAAIFRPDGTLGSMVQNGSGVQTYWYPDGMIRWRLELKDYKRVRHQMWNLSGKLISEQTYRTIR